MKGHAGVAALFRCVREHAGMADWPCAVEQEQHRPRVTAVAPTGIPVITYRADANEPTALVATFAHELARCLVETFEERAPGGDMLHEPAIELAAVFMGFGVFMANASLDSAGHELNEGESVHALAMFCVLRKIDPQSIDRHLNPHLRKYLRLAALDLARHHEGFQQLRSVFAVIPVDPAERTLPASAMSSPGS
jgi:hypothetical protein